MRERLSFDAEVVPHALRTFAERFADTECAILSTCNRVEVYVATPADSACRAEEVRHFLEGFHKIPAEQFASLLYIHEGSDAARHLFSVTAGMDSMVFGESEILAQVKNSYLSAFESGTTGPVFNTLFQMAFHLAKHIHTETGISTHPTSVASVAVRFLRDGDRLVGKRVLIVGAGRVAAQTVERLRKNEAGDVVVINRDAGRAADLAARFGGTAAGLDTLADKIAWADIVVTSTASAEPLIVADMLAPILAKRAGRPLRIVDLGVPRDVAANVAKLPGVRLSNIDDLQQTADANAAHRGEDAQAADRLVDEHVEQFAAWFEARHLGPVLAELTEQLDAYAAEQLAWLDPKLKAATAGDRKRIAQMVHRLTHRILHHPLRILKDEALQSRGTSAARLLRKLFNLTGDEEHEEK